jgi:hypothetical protein
MTMTTPSNIAARTQYVAPRGRRTLTASQTVDLLKSLTPAQRTFLAQAGQRLATK